MKRSARNLCAAFLLLVILCISASAFSFITQPMAEDNAQQVWNSVNLHMIEDADFLLRGKVSYFSVSDAGEIALLWEGNLIMLLQPDGTVDAVYRFSSTGISYLYCRDDHLVLYLVRGGILIEFTPEGELLSISKAPQNTENNRVFREMAAQEKAEFNGATYHLTRRSQLVCTGRDGTQQVLYDPGPVVSRSGLFSLFSAAVLLLIGPTIIRQVKLRRKEPTAD